MNGMPSEYGVLEVPARELLVLRRRLSLRAEWLRDRCRLWSLASGYDGYEILEADLPIALDGRMTTAEASALLRGELTDLRLAEPGPRGDRWFLS